MHQVNKIMFTKEKFGNELYIKIAQQLQILIEAGYLCTVYSTDETFEFVVIEHVSSNPLNCQPYPYYLYPDEVTYVSLYIGKKKVKELDDEINEIESTIRESEGKDIIDNMLDSKSNGGNLN